MTEAGKRRVTGVKGLMPASSFPKKDKKRKVPEPLRRAIAECTQQNASFDGLACSPFRTLEDYLGEAATVDMAYSCLLEHARAEQARSPPVIMKCVALLKRYLFRYYPKLGTLQQIDAFCVELIAEQKGAASGTWSLVRTERFRRLPGAGPSGEASAALIKSLNYVRAVVARNLPADALRPLAKPATAAAILRQESMMRVASPRGSPADRLVAQATTQAMARLIQLPDSPENYVLADVLKARWLSRSRSWAPPPIWMDSASARTHPEVKSVAHSSAAALLFGSSGHSEEHALHCENITGVSDPTLARTHMRSIAATKRTENEHSTRRDGEVVLNSVRRRVQRPLFQYRYYSEQQPLRLSEAEMEVVVAAVCAEPASQSGHAAGPALQPDPADVAASVLIKLLIDMYLVDTASAAPLALSLLQSMLDSPAPAARVRAFDLVLNLGVHAHLLEPLPADDAVARPFANNAAGSQQADQPTSSSEKSPAYVAFESWLVGVLCEMLLFLVQAEENEEEVWAAALSCLLYLTCDHGRVLRSRLALLDIRVVLALIAAGSQHGWAEELQTFLIRLLVGMLYSGHPGAVKGPTGTASAPLKMRQLAQIGGIRYVCAEFAAAQSAEARRNLFAVMLDFVLEQLRMSARRAGQRPPSEADMAAVAFALVQAEAQEALVAAFKLPAPPGEPVASNLAAAIAASLTRDVLSGRLNAELLADVAQALDSLAKDHTSVPAEFKSLVGATLANQRPGSPRPGSSAEELDREGLAWSTLRALLHSARAWDRSVGHLWLLQLLAAQLPGRSSEASPNPSSAAAVKADRSKPSSLQQQISAQDRRTAAERQKALGREGSAGGTAGSKGPEKGGGAAPPEAKVSGAVQLMSGLLRSKSVAVRRGFLQVLEGLLLLQAGEQGAGSQTAKAPDRDRSDGLMTLMSTSLWQMVAANDPARLNVLQMCTLLLWQLCGLSSVPTAEVVELAHVASPRPNPNVTDLPRSIPEGSPELRAAHVVEDCTSLARLFLLGRSLAARPLLAALPTALLYWPLMQLAPSSTEACHLATSVGSHGGWGAGGVSDVRAALLLLLIGKCSDSREALEEVGGVDFFRSLLDDADARIAYFSSTFLLKKLMTDQAEEYQRALHRLVFTAQQSNNEKLLENPYLQIRGLVQAISENSEPPPSA